MQKIKTLDGHYVYNVKKENKNYYLADSINCEKDINKLLDMKDDIKFDSVIIIFGFDTGEYLKSLNKMICTKNKVLIFEPNKEIFDENEDKITNSNIKFFLYDKNNVKAILYGVINSDNFNNLYVHDFGNYSEVYKEEYSNFIENLDCVYYTASSAINIANRFKEVFIKNFVYNLKAINTAVTFNFYENINKGVPSIIVSAGPSLNKNLNDMLKFKDKLKEYFIIAGSRTLKALMDKGIKPDMLVSIDPVDDNYDMMKNYLEEDIPLAFYEYSNRHLIKDYKGKKLFLPSVLSKIVPELKGARGLFTGGSVAHSCVDIARILGCNPIILVGQDFAFTKGKHHSNLATFESDKKNVYAANISANDIYGNDVKTNATLNMFRIKLQEYITFYNKIGKIQFINASYGAEIKGAPHMELSKVLKKYGSKNKKVAPLNEKQLTLNDKNIIYDMLGYIDVCTIEAQKGELLCEELLKNKINKSLMDIADEDKDLRRFLDVMKIVNEFENSPRRFYLGGYFDKFQFDIKEKKFRMYAKDYASLTSDLKYQSGCFLEYFKEMQSFLMEIKNIIEETLKEFEI